MQKKWKGDDSNLLPALQVEPYRLWFEFLQLASRDQSINIKKDVYAPWGDYENMPFKSWWSLHWRQLFATSIGVYEVSAVSHARDDGRLLLSVPLNQDPSRTLTQIKDLLKSHGAGQKLKSMRQGSFALSVGDAGGRAIDPSTRFLKNLSKVRLLMHLYRFWLHFPEHDERRRLEETAKAYFAWADDWNTRVTERKWKRDKIEIPFALAQYVQFLKRRGGKRRVALTDENETDVPNHRRQVARYIRKARRIADNVAVGVFPGSYETGLG